MHSFTSHGVQFNYNSDYSGLIRITDSHGNEKSCTFSEIVRRNSEPCREFVAMAAVNEGISRMENMETDDVLSNTWLRSILRDLGGSEL